MNNTTINGTNNRGPVVIAKTTANNKIANYIGMDMETHAILAKNCLRDVLYSWAPVYRMITICGLDDENGMLTPEEAKLIARINFVLGGNSPIARSFVKGDSVERALDVIQYNEKGIPSYRKIVTGNNSSSRVKYDYVNDIVLVKFSNDVIEPAAAQALSERVLAEGLTITPDNKIVFGKQEGEFINPLVWTPSNERSGQILFTPMNPDQAWEKLESIGGGSIGRKLSGEMPLAAFKKVASRLGLFATPAVEFIKTGNDSHGLLVLDHELEGADDFSEAHRKALAKIGIKIDRKQWDGAAFLSADLALDGLKNLGMKKVDIKKALMFAFQLRVSQVYAKVFGEALHQSVMNKIAGYVIAELDKIEEATGKKLYRIYGNANNIGMILDSNAAKIVDLSQDAPAEGMQVYLLDIAKASESRTSTQMMSKFALMNNVATSSFMNNKAYDDCVNYADSIGDQSFSLLNEDVNVWQTLLNIGKTMPAASKTALDIYSDENIMTRLLSDVSKKHEAAYKKCQVKIDSMFERALFDSTYLLTDGKVDSLLGTDDRGAIECYSNDILEKYSEEIKAIEENDALSPEQKKQLLDLKLTASVVKYPTPGTEEIAPVRFLTAKELRSRVADLVANGVIDEDVAKIVWNYFSFTSYGVIKIAADNALKHKLAGMDTDYDGVVVILEQELNAILLDVYAKRKAALEEREGLIAPHGGTIPYIDSSKDAQDFFTSEEDMNQFLYGEDDLSDW